MNIQEPTHFQGNKRVFDRISVNGSIRFEEIDYTINDLSVGGLSVIGAVPGWEEGEIRQVQFTILHGALDVSGKVNCQCLENRGKGITRFKLVNPSEDLAELFRAATLRNASGSEYDIGWLPEKSSKLQEAEDTPQRRPLTSYFLSLPMLVLMMFVLLLGTFVARMTEGDAYWLTERHEIVSPVTGQITSLGTGPFSAGETISEITAMTVNGDDLPFTVRANVASVSVDWRFSTGDHVTVDDILGHLRNVPRTQVRYYAIVSLEVPFFSPGPGDSIVLESVGGKRIVGKLQRMLTQRQLHDYAGIDNQFGPHKSYALVEINDAGVDFSASPEVRILDTVLENKFR